MLEQNTNFIPGHNPLSMKFESPQKLWFVFRQDHIVLAVSNSSKTIPQAENPPAGLFDSESFFIGSTNGMACFCAHAPEKLPTGYEEINLRQAFDFLPENIYKAASRATQVLEWDQTHLFCGHCATRLKTKDAELARFCPECGQTSYPRINPAIIVLISKGDELLLGRSPHFPPGRYSFLAGFVEAGETPEEAVHREIMEEVSIKVKDVKYICSQPWPFPNSLMLGFFASYESGTIKTDAKEIEDAAWFKHNQLPYMPGKLSLARRLLDIYTESNNLKSCTKDTYNPQPW